MKLSLEVTGAAEAAQLLATVASRLEQSPRPLLEILAGALQRHLRSHIETQTGPNGSWPALAPVTRKIRDFYGYPPDGPALVRAGGLLQSITTLALQDQSVEVGTTTPFARTLQDGGLVDRSRRPAAPAPSRPSPSPTSPPRKSRTSSPSSPPTTSEAPLPDAVPFSPHPGGGRAWGGGRGVRSMPDPSVYPSLPWSLDAKILLALRHELLADAPLRTAFSPTDQIAILEMATVLRTESLPAAPLSRPVHPCR